MWAVPGRARFGLLYGRQLRAEALESRMLLSTAPSVMAVEMASTQWTTSFYDYIASQGLGDNGFAIPAGASQTKTLPWTNIDKVVIQFTEDVDIDKADLTISGVNVPYIGFSKFFYDAREHVATWTLAAPLAKNTYQLDLHSDGADPVVDLDGERLNGEWTTGQLFPSGNSTAGGDFQFIFKVLPGDVNQSGTVNSTDYSDEMSRVPSAPGNVKYTVKHDVDGSGTINSTDLQAVVARMNQSSPSGTPVGVSNDAPTTRGLAPVNITNVTADAVFSLYSAFDDAETPDSQLTYQLVSNSNPSLFDYVTINQATGQLIVNALGGGSGFAPAAAIIGQSHITIAATDNQGQRTDLTVDINVNQPNQPPHIEFFCANEGLDVWKVWGTVTDDDSVEGLVVWFAGQPFTTRATVNAYGQFEFFVVVTEMNWGDESAYTLDRWNAISNVVTQPVDLL